METANSDFKVTAMIWFEGLKRHLKMIVITFVIIFTASAVYIMKLPNVYHAETRILVNPQKVSDKYVSSAVSMGATERLNTLSQQVLSTSRLEAIFDDFNLFPKLRGKVGHQELIDRMRHNIGIELKQSSDGPSSFTLSYEGDSPQEVAGVTNRLAESFIAWNLHDREQEAQGTTEFLESELVESKAKLDALEQQLRVYKLDHLGELPDQLQANIQTLSRLQIQLQANVEARSNLDRDAAIGSFEQESVLSSRGTVTPVSARQRLSTQVDAARRDLAELNKRYTPEHPDVQEKRRELDELEAQLTQARDIASTGAPVAKSTEPVDPRGQLMVTERSHLLAAQRDIEGQISRYQSRVDAEPIREQEISQLLRDYDTARQHYALLLEKSYSAQMASELERKQQGGSFTLLDIARIPDAPVGPKRLALMVGAFFFSLFAGIGIGVALELSDPSIKSEAQLREALPGIPLLGLTPRLSSRDSKPKIVSPKQLTARRQDAHV